MGPLKIYCTLCEASYVSVGEIPAICPNCQRETRWTTFAPVTEPLGPYKLTKDDRYFLHSIDIQTEDA